MQYLILLAIGLCAGVLAGFFGVGGGILIIPGLMLLLGYDQLRAQGTSLGVLLLPVGILGFLQYWHNPAVKIDLLAVALISVALAAGAYFGGRWSNQVDVVVLRKCFAVFMVLTATYLFFKR